MRVVVEVYVEADPKHVKVQHLQGEEVGGHVEVKIDGSLREFRAASVGAIAGAARTMAESILSAALPDPESVD